MNRVVRRCIAVGLVFTGTGACRNPASVVVSPPPGHTQHRSTIRPPPTPLPPPPPPTAESEARDRAAFEAAFKPFLPRIGRVQAASVFLIKPKRAAHGGFHGYPILQRTDLPNGKAEQLLRLLDEATTYHGPAYGCYAPGAAVSISGVQGQLDLAICFDCQYLDVDPEAMDIRSLSDLGIARLHDLLGSVLPELAAKPRSTAANPSLQRTSPGRSPG